MLCALDTTKPLERYLTFKAEIRRLTEAMSL